MIVYDHSRKTLAGFCLVALEFFYSHVNFGYFDDFFSFLLSFLYSIFYIQFFLVKMIFLEVLSIFKTNRWIKNDRNFQIWNKKVKNYSFRVERWVGVGAQNSVKNAFSSISMFRGILYFFVTHNLSEHYFTEFPWVCDFFLHFCS